MLYSCKGFRKHAIIHVNGYCFPIILSRFGSDNPSSESGTTTCFYRGVVSAHLRQHKIHSVHLRIGALFLPFLFLSSSFDVTACPSTTSFYAIRYMKRLHQNAFTDLDKFASTRTRMIATWFMVTRSHCVQGDLTPIKAPLAPLCVSPPPIYPFNYTLKITLIKNQNFSCTIPNFCANSSLFCEHRPAYCDTYKLTMFPLSASAWTISP